MAKSRGARRRRLAAESAERQSAQNQPDADPAELQSAQRRTAEATTVAWMLSILATLAAEILTAVGVLLVEYVPTDDEAPGLIQMIPGSLGFTALATGAVCLALTPIVHRIRAVPPPLAIEIVAVVAGGIPWLLLGISWLAKVAQ